MLKYRIASTYPTPEIVAVECVRETEACVFMKAKVTKRNPAGEDRVLKKSGWHEYYDTWEEAHAELVSKTNKRVDGARNHLAHAIRTDTAIAAMVKP